MVGKPSMGISLGIRRLSGCGYNGNLVKIPSQSTELASQTQPLMMWCCILRDDVVKTQKGRRGMWAGGL